MEKKRLEVSSKAAVPVLVPAEFGPNLFQTFPRPDEPYDDILSSFTPSHCLAVYQKLLKYPHTTLRKSELRSSRENTGSNKTQTT
jgi:hypothetical protein